MSYRVQLFLLNGYDRESGLRLPRVPPTSLRLIGSNEEGTTGIRCPHSGLWLCPSFHWQPVPPTILGPSSVTEGSESAPPGSKEQLKESVPVDMCSRIFKGLSQHRDQAPFLPRPTIDEWELQESRSLSTVRKKFSRHQGQPKMEVM